MALFPIHRYDWPGPGAGFGCFPGGAAVAGASSSGGGGFPPLNVFARARIIRDHRRGGRRQATDIDVHVKGNTIRGPVRHQGCQLAREGRAAIAASGLGSLSDRTMDTSCRG